MNATVSVCFYDRRANFNLGTLWIWLGLLFQNRCLIYCSCQSLMNAAYYSKFTVTVQTQCDLWPLTWPWKLAWPAQFNIQNILPAFNKIVCFPFYIFFYYLSFLQFCLQSCFLSTMATVFVSLWPSTVFKLNSSANCHLNLKGQIHFASLFQKDMSVCLKKNHIRCVLLCIAYCC